MNDGSTDDSLAIIRQLQEKDPRISNLDLSCNCGKESAMSAGIDYIRGEALVIIDADLQDPPELIPLMFEELQKGYGDPVVGYPSLMSVLLFLGGAILLSLGIIGEYLGIIYKEIKRRPAYFVNEYKNVSPAYKNGE